MNKVYSFVLLFSVSIYTNMLIAQKETWNWQFGNNVNLSFASGAPSVTFNSAINSWEGVSSISDRNGNLLLYIHSDTIWNRNHQPLPNGGSLKGCRSSTQASLIVRKPCYDSIFYVFTTDCAENNGNSGFNYSIVDLRLDNGQGDVVSKNNLLFSPSSEKVTAVLHSNNQDLWIVTHSANGNDFLAYLLSSTGLDTIPIISSVGSLYTSFYGGNQGYMKASPNGSLIVCATSNSNSKGELFEFDNSTGIVFNFIPLSPVPDSCYSYGVEFSSNSKVLYLTQQSYLGIGTLSQFDISVLDTTTIWNSQSDIDVDNSGFYFYGALQLGPDDCIYMLRCRNSGVPLHYMDKINFPYVLGLGCNYQQNIINVMNPNISPNMIVNAIGFPNMLVSYFDSAYSSPINPYAALTGNQTICSGSSAQISTLLSGNGPWQLSYSDGSSNFSQTGISSSPFVWQLSPSQTTTYTLTGLSNNLCPSGQVSGSARVQVESPPTAGLSGLDTLCFGDSTGLPILLSGNSPWSVIYTDGANSDTLSGINNNPFVLMLSPQQSTTYSLLQVADTYCTGAVNGSASIEVHPLVQAMLSPDTALCPGSAVNLSFHISGVSPWHIDYSEGSVQYSLSGITQSPYLISVTPTSATSYQVLQVSDANACTSGIGNSIHLNLLSPPTAILSGNTQIQAGDSVVLTVVLSGTPPWSLQWSDGTSQWQSTGIQQSPFIITLTPQVNTTYRILTVETICEGMSTGQYVVDVVTGRVEERYEDEGFQVYPNPTGNILYILISDSYIHPVQSTTARKESIYSDISNPYSSQDCLLNLYAMDGRLIRSQSQPWSQTMQLSVSDLPTGIYLLRVMQGRNVYTQKVVVGR